MVDLRPSLLILVAIVSLPSALSAAALAITKNADLTFGSFVGGGGYAGSVTVDTAGARSASGAILLLGGQPFAAARFTISGNAGTHYSMTLPASAVVTSGAVQATLSQLTTSIPTSGTLPTEGSVTFTVGGTVTVNTTQNNGTYSGTFDIVVGRN